MEQLRSKLPTFVLGHNSVDEQQAHTLLLRWFELYSLDKWLYTDVIRIEDDVIPHSHPILTLSPYTRWSNYLADPEQLLAAYIHEQLHWFLLLEDKDADAQRARNELRVCYPDLPIALPAGCGSLFSNYLHVLVNYLEYQSLIELFDSERARQVIKRIPHYTKVYELVVQESERIGAVMTKYGLVVDAQPPLVKSFVEIGWRN